MIGLLHDNEELLFIKTYYRGSENVSHITKHVINKVLVSRMHKQLLELLEINKRTAPRW